jgi:Smg protein
MFEVLAYVYENYWSGQDCPEWDHLERKLSSVGFESEEIAVALTWLSGLTIVANPSPDPTPQAASSMRVYSIAEQDHIGRDCLGFISFLEASSVLPATMREIVVDRAMAAPGSPLALDDLKIIVLMVYWSFGEEPDALVLDELCDDASERIAH